jgi:peptidyl-dipeptidase Dcp
MSEYRTQAYDPSTSARVTPIVVNNCNFVKAASSDSSGGAPPSLLSFDDAVTLFHEFGHGCHGMLSDVKFQRLAGTSVLRDFVELPSQLMEHWLLQPKVLRQHAKHWRTQEPMPEVLVEKLTAAKLHGAGFNTVEYAACALLDQRLHALSLDQLEHYHQNQAASQPEGKQEEQLLPLDLGLFEQEQLAELGMPQGIILRHRLPHFQHLFSSSSYASAYYVYLWAEVLDADAFDAFLEAGDCFDPEVAKRVRECIYSVGGSVEPGAAFRAFRGRDPDVKPMLKKKLGIAA